MFDAIIGFLGNHYSGIIGAGIGYLWAIYLSRRTEFNEAADTVFAGLHQEVEHYWSTMGHVSSIDFAMLRRRLHWYQIGGFDRALSEYEKAKKDCIGHDECGGVIRTEPNNVKEATIRLMSYSKRR